MTNTLYSMVTGVLAKTSCKNFSRMVRVFYIVIWLWASKLHCK